MVLSMTGASGLRNVTYLLLFGKLPDQEELNGFSGILANQRMLPRNFVRDVIMKAPIQRYYERSVKKRADTLFLRQRPG